MKHEIDISDPAARSTSTRLSSTAACIAVVLAWATLAGCERRPERTSRAEIESAAVAVAEARMARVLKRELGRIARRADSIDDIFHPLPLLTAAQEAALRRHPNRTHIARGRRLGIPRGADSVRLARWLSSGRLVRLESRTEHWVVRELDSSSPFVVPAARVLLTRIGERFHERLERRGAPAFRFEISSVLRTAADQEALRRTNPNAALGVSAHEFGTTVDVAYDGYAAPAGAAVDIDSGGEEWLRRPLEGIASRALERVAARRSRELTAILGRVLRELQDEGAVLVTLERRQPVFHLTVARRLEPPDP